MTVKTVTVESAEADVTVSASGVGADEEASPIWKVIAAADGVSVGRHDPVAQRIRAVGEPVREGDYDGVVACARVKGDRVAVARKEADRAVDELHGFVELQDSAVSGACSRASPSPGVVSSRTACAFAGGMPVINASTPPMRMASSNRMTTPSRSCLFPATVRLMPAYDLEPVRRCQQGAPGLRRPVR